MTGAHVDDPSAITGSAGVDGTADPAKPKPFSAAEMPGDPCDVLPHDAASQRAYDRCRESYRTSWLEFIAGTHAHVKHNDKFSKRSVRKVIDGAAQNVDGWRFFVVVPDPPPDLVTDSVRIEVGGVTPTPNPNYRRYIFEPAQAFVIQVGLFDDQIAPGVHRVLVTAEDGTPLFDREVELSASKSAR